MGFLTRYGVLAAAVAVAGCSSDIAVRDLRFDVPARWAQAGRSASRNAVADAPLMPPLTLAWQADLDGGQELPAPMIAAGTLFVPSVNGSIQAFDPADGSERGAVSYKAWISAGPAVVEDSLMAIPVIAQNASLACVSLRGDRVVWSRDVSPIEAPVLSVAGDLVVATLDARVLRLHAADTTTIWSARLPDGCIAAPAASDSAVILGTTGGDVIALAAATGRMLWRVPTLAPIQAPPVVVEGEVFTVNRSGSLRCLNARDGSVLWSAELRTAVFAAPAVDRGAVIVACADHTVRSLARIDGHERWRFNGGGVFSVQPVIAGPVVAVAGLDGVIRLLDFETGEEVWSHRVDARVRTPILASEGRLVVCTDEREVLVFTGARR